MTFLFVSEKSDRSEIQLVLGLHTRGHRVVVVCHPAEQHIPTLKAAGLVVHPILIRSRVDFRAIQKLRSILRNEEPEACYATMNKGIAALSLASWRGASRLFTYRGTMGNLSRWNPTTYLTHLNPKLAGIICNCKAVRESLITFGLPPGKLTTIYKGHDPAWYQPTCAKAPIELMGAFRVVCVANVRPVKGVDILIRALAEDNSEDTHLYLIGENRDPSIAVLVQSLGLGDRVHFLGFRTDLPDLYPHFNLSVMPSRDREGVPRAIVESIFSGVAVVASRVGGIPELIESRHNGILVPPGDPRSLAEAIAHCRTCPEERAQYAQHARADIAKMLTIENYIDEFERVLSS